MQPLDCRPLSVSVIIPTYNRSRFVVDAIHSALDQTQPPHEIIVVDDGSTDDTPEVLDRFGPPVIALRQPNRGRSAARNRGIAAATGEAVACLDSDDFWQPEFIERCATLLARQPDVGVVCTDAWLVDRTGRPTCLRSSTMPGCHPSGMVLGELGRRCFPTISSMVRRSSLGGVTFEEGMECGEDYDFWRRLAVQCRFAYIGEPLMCYRIHDGMTVLTERAAALESELEVQRRIMAMPEFGALPARERAAVFCAHGAKNAMLGHADVARRSFARAIRTAPTAPGGYLLGALSLLGTRPLQWAILKRRRVIGDHHAAEAGAQLLKQISARDSQSGMSHGTQDVELLEEEAVHG